MSGEIDLVSPEVYIGGIPFDWLKEIRHQPGLYWHVDPRSRRGGFWVVAKQRQLDFVSKNPQLFSSYERGCLLNEPPEEWLPFVRTQFLNMDPPRHNRFRRIAGVALTPSRVAAKESRLEEIMTHIIDPIARRGRCEFVREVAAQLPLIAICELLGIPDLDRNDFIAWGDTIIAASDPDSILPPEDILQALKNIFKYADQLADKNRSSPVSEPIEAMLRAEIDGVPLSNDEFCNTFMMLVVGGNETTRMATAHGMRLLIEYPDQLEILSKDPALVPHAVEEILRYHPPVIAFARTAMSDIEVDGTRIRAGDKVVLFYPSVGRDEDVFRDPDVFDVTRNLREDVQNQHRAFGVGQHFCLGSNLARLELRIAFTEITRRIRKPRFDGPPEWLRSNFVSGLRSMPIVFDREP